MTAIPKTQPVAAASGGLRRELRFWETIALSSRDHGADRGGELRAMCRQSTWAICFTRAPTSELAGAA
jgi:hypothetical protein